MLNWGLVRISMMSFSICVVGNRLVVRVMNGLNMLLNSWVNNLCLMMRSLSGMINVMRGRHLVRDNTMLIRVHLICHEFLEKNFWNLYVFSAVMTLLSHVGSL